jgi:glycosyl transferase family 2
VEAPVDLSIIIAHRGDPIGLWATLHSCEIELDGSGLTYEYCICVNGEAGSKRASKTSLVALDLERLLSLFSKSGRIKHLTLMQRDLSPPTARQKAASHATGEYLFFLDNHCLVGKQYFSRALHSMRRYNMDMLHSTTRFFSGDIDVYHYKLKLAHNFWAEGATTPEKGCMPYRIAAAGHGGFVVRADVWREVGGYWDGFEGYGGEEIYFDLKMALLGKTNWIDPQFVHYHYAGTRSYPRHYSAAYYRNLMMCANIIGGEKWLHRVYESFAKNFPAPKGHPMYGLMMEAEEKSRSHAQWLSKQTSLTLDELLTQFESEGTAFT